MNTSFARPGILFPLGIVALWSFFAVVPARGAIERIVEKSFPAVAGGTLYASTFGGSITVQTGSVDTVKIVVHEKIQTGDEAEADRMLENLVLSLEATDTGVTASAEYKGSGLGWLRRTPLEVSIVATVPPTFNLQARTSGGNIQVANLSGRVEVSTSGGNIQLGRLSGETKAKTDGGNINMDAAAGPVWARTSGGNVTLRESSAPVDLGTSGGDIRVEKAGATVQANTSGGTVSAHFTVAPTADCKLSTSGGNVRVALPAGAAVTLSARTSGGHVKTTLPVTVIGKNTDDKLEGTMNGGGPKLTLHTSGGNITIDPS